MFDRPQLGERVILVHIQFNRFHASGDLAECRVLADSAGADVIQEITGRRNQPDPKYFIGSGKVDELLENVLEHEIDLVIFDHPLSPSQERNIEAKLKCRVLDRTGLILDIFASRARTHEGKLQVELAQLRYMSTRLVRGWTHLERQKGGIGLRGPGETQLETDRRLLRNRIKSLRERLNKVRNQRAQSARARKRSKIPTIVFVGYTNAGKSTLFNFLSGAEVYAADKLFATLDPTLRKIQLPHFGDVIIADTVGFIKHLPHDLVDAFRATLEEAADADLLLHVVDASRPDFHDMQETVFDVLKQIHADQVPQLMVLNKIDLMNKQAVIQYNHSGLAKNVWLSTQSGDGCDLLLQVLLGRLASEIIHCCIKLNPQESATRAKLYAIGAVLTENSLACGSQVLEIKLPVRQFEQMIGVKTNC